MVRIENRQNYPQVAYRTRISATSIPQGRRPSVIAEDLKLIEEFKEGKVSKNSTLFSRCLALLKQYNPKITPQVTLNHVEYISESNRPLVDLFMKDLGSIYALRYADPGSLQWSSLEEGVSIYSTPKQLVEMPNPCPMFSIKLSPKRPPQEGRDGGYFGVNACAPIFINSIEPFSSMKEKLRTLEINRKSGLQDSQEFFPEEKRTNVADFALDSNNQLGISSDTPVLEAIAFVPISQKGEYQTFFSPELIIRDGEHNAYKLTVIHQDALNFNTEPFTHGGKVLTAKLWNADKTHSNFYADFVPDMNQIRRGAVPRNAGQIIIIATPIPKPEPRHNYLPIGSPGLRGGASKGGFGTVGNVDIRFGDKTGGGQEYKGSMTPSSNGRTSIYCVKVLGFKPGDVQAFISRSDLRALANSMSL